MHARIPLPWLIVGACAWCVAVPAALLVVAYERAARGFLNGAN